MFNFHSFRDILGCYLTAQLGVKYKPKVDIILHVGHVKLMYLTQKQGLCDA